MNYRKLKKGTRYTVQQGKKVRRGVYRSRYFNDFTNAWHYVFELGLGQTWTPEAPKCKIVLA